ncbi:MAG: hypothetical protein KDK90_21690 [Leptospiraceae bacterium]|nr:hypothetical protein [Leptospiraceae bacterium]
MRVVREKLNIILSVIILLLVCIIGAYTYFKRDVLYTQYLEFKKKYQSSDSVQRVKSPIIIPDEKKLSEKGKMAKVESPINASQGNFTKNENVDFQENIDIIPPHSKKEKVRKEATEPEKSTKLKKSKKKKNSSAQKKKKRLKAKKRSIHKQVTIKSLEKRIQKLEKKLKAKKKVAKSRKSKNKLRNLEKRVRKLEKMIKK